MGGSPSRSDGLTKKSTKRLLDTNDQHKRREIDGNFHKSPSDLKLDGLSTDSLSRANNRSHASEEDKMLSVCSNCGKEFDHNQNTEKSCRYHTGKKQSGKEGPPKWNCCNKEDLESTASHKLNIAVVGCPGVGKTSLITRVVLSTWIEDIRKPSSTDTSMVSLLTNISDSVSYTFEFTEIPEPQAGDSLLLDHICAFAEAGLILLVCAIDNLESLLKLSSYSEKIKNAKDGGFYPVVLVLNKTDLENRTIEAKDLEDLDFSKCSVDFSAKSGYGSENLIESIMEQADLFHLFNNGCCTSKHIASSPRKTRRK